PGGGGTQPGSAPSGHPGDVVAFILEAGPREGSRPSHAGAIPPALSLPYGQLQEPPQVAQVERQPDAQDPEGDREHQRERLPTAERRDDLSGSEAKAEGDAARDQESVERHQGGHRRPRGQGATGVDSGAGVQGEEGADAMQQCRRRRRRWCYRYSGSTMNSRNNPMMTTVARLNGARNTPLKIRLSNFRCM